MLSNTVNIVVNVSSLMLFELITALSSFNCKLTFVSVNEAISFINWFNVAICSMFVLFFDNLFNDKVNTSHNHVSAISSLLTIIHVVYICFIMCINILLLLS